MSRVDKGKQVRVGTQFYKAKGLKAVTIHLEPEAVKKLRMIALTKDQSLQEIVRQILNKYLASAKD